MTAIKWLNVVIISALMMIAAMMLTISNGVEAFSLCDLMNVLSIPLFLLTFALFFAMYNNQLLPDCFQRLIDNIMKED